MDRGAGSNDYEVILGEWVIYGVERKDADLGNQHLSSILEVSSRNFRVK